jgi:tRNA A37 threonylcarbamoyltransferase TsaD
MEPTQQIIALPEDVSSYLAANYEDIIFKHLEDRLKGVFDHLEERQRKEEGLPPINGLVVVGGVAANQHLRT